MEYNSILKALKLNGTDDYQQFINDLGQADQSQIIAKLTDPLNGRYFNQFIDNLINLIGTQVVHRITLTNPLAEFKRYSVSDMKGIQEIGKGLIKAQGYDPNNNNLFKRSKSETFVAYHAINRRDVLETTVNKDLLESAFRGGRLVEFINETVNSLTNSDNMAEYIKMLEIFGQFNRDYGIYNVQVPDILSDTATRGDSEVFLEELRNHGDDMMLPNAKYNYYGIVKQETSKRTLWFITTNKVKNRINVQTLANTFNLSKADFDIKIKVVNELPKTLVNDPTTDKTFGILIEESAMIFGDAMNDYSTIYNPKSREWNYYLHRWSIISLSLMGNIIKFTTEPTTNIPTISFTPEEFDVYTEDVNGEKLGLIIQEINNKDLKGSSTYLKGVLTGAVDPTSPYVDKEFTSTKSEITKIVNPDGDELVIKNSFIDTAGVVHVQENAQKPGTTITIRSESTYLEGGFSSTVTTEIEQDYYYVSPPLVPPMGEAKVDTNEAKGGRKDKIKGVINNDNK